MTNIRQDIALCCLFVFIPFQWQLPSGANAANTKPLNVQTTGIIGAGTMGTGIAVSLLRAGYPVILVEQNQEVCLSYFELLKSNIFNT